MKFLFALFLLLSAGSSIAQTLLINGQKPDFSRGKYIIISRESVLTLQADSDSLDIDVHLVRNQWGIRSLKFETVKGFNEFDYLSLFKPDPSDKSADAQVKFARKGDRLMITARRRGGSFADALTWILYIG